MSKEENAVAKNPESEVAASAMPSYLAEFQGDTGTEDISQFVKPARMKIVQKQANSQLLEEFKIGDLIVTPVNSLVAAKTETLVITPIFFWAEWCKWNPYELKDTLPTFADRSTDPNSPLRAKALNERTREEAYPDLVNGKQVFFRYVEHLNFALRIKTGDCAGMVAVQSFYRAQHQDGSNFNQLITMRGKNVPLYAMNFEGATYHKSYGGNDWYGLKVTNPATVGPFVSEAEFEENKDLFKNFKKAHAAGSISVDFDDEQGETAVSKEPSAEAKF